MYINHKVFLNINLVLSMTLYYAIPLTLKFLYFSLSVLQKKEKECTVLFLKAEFVSFVL